MSALDGFSIPQTVLRYFDLPSSSYTDASIRDIAERRRTYPGSLLFLDQLLGLASVDGHALYPPTSPADLRRLIHTIRSADIDRLKQDCFIYYLLLDADYASAPEINGEAQRPNGHHANGEMMRLDKGKGKAKEPVGNAEEFARRRCLPGVWRGFIRGYWALDHGKWEDAVESLSNPAITSLNFLPEIFTLISTHVSPPAHALSLAHSLFTALSPQLESEPMIQLRVLSLASASSLSDAFSFIRSQAPDTRRLLREVVYRWALGSSSRIPSGRGPPSVQPTVLTSLLHLPLDADESAHLTHFLTHPPRSIPPPALDLLHELVTVRLIHQGQYAECLALDKELAGSGVGKEEDRQKRRDRVKEFISILPEAQRRVLELDGELRREDEGRRIEANGDIDMSSGAGPSNEAQQIAAPSPIRPRAPFSLSQMTNTPASPAARAIQPQTRHVSSPFSGPPQFARTDSPGLGIGTPGTPSRSAAPTARLASGSPFNLPPRVAQLEVPRPVRRIIDDDAEEEARGRKMDQKRRAEEAGMGTPTPMPAAKEKEAESAAEAEAEPIPEGGGEEADKEGDDVNLAEPAEPTPQPQPNGSDSAAEMPPPPIPQPKTPARKSSRQTLAPASKPTTSKRQTPPPPASGSGRSGRRQTTVPPDEPAPAPASERGTESVDESRPSRKGKSKSKADEAKEESEDKAYPMPGAFTNPNPTPRSRLTRSASRAVLDDEQPNPGSPAKRPRTRTATTTQQGKSQRAGSPTESERSVRRATRELSVASSAGGGRRETRASVTPGPGPRGGSPTGSVKSVASTRSRREGTARGREGSITPRVTRTKK